ncbi:hypothetical protein MPC1_370009 [Methylocella tundrae]|nr:hypothetical protein MPC1_370009 [Methylocella tundrae]
MARTRLSISDGALEHGAEQEQATARGIVATMRA